MLRIWGRLSSVNVQKVVWCCDEIGLAYERIDAGGTFGRNNTPEYLAMNPNGLVPVIEDVPESVAVIVWLPVVLRVALKVPVPAVRVVLAGSVAAPSLLVKWTVPA